METSTMYGLINNALKDMIQERFGQDTWDSVLDESGVPDDSFLTMRAYDDSITYALAGAASKVLKTPVDDCLEMFGEYWVLVTATNSYDMLLKAAGKTMVEFLGNMNTLHDRITSTFLNYAPPEFFVEQIKDRYFIHYVSQREGLTPFVVGILKGLGVRFNTSLKFVSQKSVEVDRGEHTVFEVEMTAA